MRHVIVPGSLAPPETSVRPDDVGRLIATVHVAAARSDATALQDIDVPDSHLVEVELENGVVLWRRLDTLETWLPLGRAARVDGALVLPTTLSFGPPGRAAGGVLVRLFRFFDTSGLADDAALLAARKIEDKLVRPGALLHCPSLSDPAPVTHPIPSETDILILLHGTGSSTQGSFGDLDPDAAASPDWRKLRDRFTGPDGVTHIYGFDHRTLTAGPVENAIEFLRQLPERAHLHLLSHSRGGLVGEVLARGTRGDGGAAFDATDVRLLGLARRHDPESLTAERAHLDEVNRLLAEKQPVIRSFVRVACPARGTILASERLDLYLSVVANLIRLVPGPHRPFFDVFRSFVRAVVATRTDPRVLPGLEAMMPDGPLIAMLNRTDIAVTAPLLVVGGDIQPSGLLRAIAVMASDLFYREDHDIVVNTAAMLGGAPRAVAGTARLFLDRGGEVTHFSYFSNPRPVARIIGALTGSDTGKDLHPLQPDRAPPWGSAPRGEGRAIGGDRPLVFVLPGMMGSHLRKSGRRIWMDPVELALGGLAEIGADGRGRLAGGVGPAGALEAGYGGLAAHLGRQNDVTVFDYDWRKSMTEAADRLAEEIRDALRATETTRPPIRILAHSTGGLVARSLIARHPDLWREITEARPGGRLVMLGTPNQGSAATCAALLGQDAMIRQLAGFDLKHSLAEVIAAIMPMPGILELLPTGSDYAQYRASAWAGFQAVAPPGWSPPRQAWLDAARSMHEDLRAALDRNPGDVAHMFYIAGKADATISAVEVDGGRLRLLATTRGDGRVTWRAGQLPGLRRWFAPATAHGDLVRDPSLFPAISEILAHGETRHLPEIPQDGRSETERVFDLPPPPLIYPGPDELASLAMGGRPQVLSDLSRIARDRVEVCVRHGDLRHETGTIAVGHYAEAPLLSAERALDAALDGRLGRHRDLGLYPGALNSASVFFRDRPDIGPGIGPQAALVVGLGEFGKLSRQALTGTLAQAMLRFALRWREQTRPDPETPCHLTTLLIGQRDGRLSIADSVRASLDALANCNERLGPGEGIRKLTLLELFEDKAAEAQDALAELAAQDDLPPQIVAAGRLEQGRGGRRRNGQAAPEDWEHQVAIAVPEDAPSRFRFEALGGGAAAEQRDVTVDRARIDRHLARGTASPTTDTELGQLLFEWLIPHDMKPGFSDGRNLTLILDDAAAGYPWELMQDNWIQAREPVAVRANMLRQLRRSRYPDRPLVAASARVLLVGDPVSDLPPLPGAEREVREVERLFRQGGWPEGEIHCFTGEAGRRMSTELSLRENRVLHFAGHGVRDHGPDRVTGLVLGPGDILQPAYIRSLRRIPEFVFLNCCHVGGIARQGGDAPDSARTGRGDLAASMAVEFIRCGTAAVIAAGWEIDDAAAAEFCQRFYDGFLSGAPFGEAVRAARLATWKRYPDRNTWGAYQCYGDTQFQLRKGVGGPGPRPPRRDFVTLSQALIALEGLTAEARAARGLAELRAVFDQFADVTRRLDGLPDWRGDARLLEALGQAAAELGDFSRAIGFFEAAAGCTPARHSAAMLSDLHDLRIAVADPSRRGQAIRAMIAHLEAGADPAGQGLTPATRARLGDCHLRLAAHL
ncbi:MAG: CHAT domain-containing protein, partial [Rhodobacteraceae bacterium]